MSGQLDHSPARIIRELLIDLSSGSATSGLSSDWAVTVGDLPDTPDNVMMIRDSQGILDGRAMVGGLRLIMHGFQVTIRAQDQQSGYLQANDIAVAVDAVWNSTVIIGSSTYLVTAISRTGDVIYVGTDKPQSNLHLFTINARVSLVKTA